MLTETDILARWKALAGNSSPQPWTSDEDVSGLLEAFSPTGEGCEAILEGVPCGEEITARLREVYAATNHGTPGLYLIPRPQVRLPRERVAELLQSYIAKWRQVAQALADNEAVEVLGNMPAIVWAKERPAQQMGDDNWASYMVDLQIDFMLFHVPRVESPAWLLNEALYRATTYFAVQYYVLWPLYAPASEVSDLYQEEFELWKEAVDFTFQDQRTLLVWEI